MSHKDGRVILSAWVEPDVRAHAREAAKIAGIAFSAWVERAIMRSLARESFEQLPLKAEDDQ